MRKPISACFRLVYSAAILLLPAILHAGWTLPSSPVVGSTYSLQWSGSVTDYSAFLNVQAPGVSTWETWGGAGGTPGPQITIYATDRSFSVAGVWSLKITSGSTTVSTTTLTVLPPPDTTAPTIPSGLTSTNVTVQSFTLSWTASTDNVGVSGYEIYKGGALLGTATGTSYAVSGLALGTSYAMQVRARDAAGNWSALCTAVNLSTAADTSAPSVPAGLASSSVTMTSFTLSWTAPTDNVGVTGYEVYKGGSLLGTATGTSFAVSGLAPGTAYAMQVRARDAAGNWSALCTAVNLSTAADTSAPSVPGGLASSNVTKNSFSVSWTASTDNVAVTGYVVYRGASSVGTTGSTSYVSTGLAADTAYVITVKARDAAGNVSAASASLSVKTLPEPDTQAPSVPTSLTGTNATMTSLTLTWTASTDNVAVTTYEVARDGVSLGTANSTSFVVSGLAAGAAYAMTVRAGDAAGNWSAWSSAANIATAPDTQAPGAPGSLAANSITPTGFTLTWAAATDNVAVTAYEVARNSTSLGTTTATSLPISGLTPATAYAMTVRARDAAGNWSAWCTALNVSTAVGGNRPPVVALSAPLANADVIASTAITVTATASDPDGTITKVEFFEGATKIGTATTSPYSIAWTPTTVGRVQLQARATDSAGGSCDSALVPVDVTPVIPHTAGFENSEGFAAGTLDGQRGWTALAGVQIADSASAKAGNRLLTLTAGSVPVTASLAVGALQSTPPISFVDFYAKPRSATDAATGRFLTVDGVAATLLKVSAIGRVQVAAPSGSASPIWQNTVATLLLDAADVTTDWVRFTVRLNYGTRTADVYVAGKLVAYDIALPNEAVDVLRQLALTAAANRSLGIDQVAFSYVHPLFADTNNDGIDDAWEIANGLSLAANNRNGNPSGDSHPNIKKWMLGMSPRAYFAGTLPDTPIGADSDGDGMPDTWEHVHGLNPFDPADAALDRDGDGASNRAEYLAGRNPEDRADSATALPNGCCVVLRTTANSYLGVKTADWSLVGVPNP